jgi:hypothetical protein
MIKLLNKHGTIVQYDTQVFLFVKWIGWGKSKII